MWFHTSIFHPVIAYDGIICGNWSPFKMALDSNFFIGEHNGRSLERRIEQYLETMGKGMAKD